MSTIQMFLNEESECFEFAVIGSQKYKDLILSDIHITGYTNPLEWVLPQNYKIGDTVNILEFNFDGPIFEFVENIQVFREKCAKYYTNTAMYSTDEDIPQGSASFTECIIDGITTVDFIEPGSGLGTLKYYSNILIV